MMKDERSVTSKSVPFIINPMPVQFKSLQHGQKGCIFQQAFKFTYYIKTCVPSRKKIITIKLKN